MKQILIYFLIAVLAMGTGGFITDFFLDGEPDIIRQEMRTIEVVEKPYYQRIEINDVIKNMIENGEMDRILDVYAEVCGDTSLAHLITSFALIYDIPVSLLYSIIEIESGFDPGAVNKNTDGSIDRGLMALNSKTFSRFTNDQIYDIETNLRLGCEHLVMLKNKYNTWGKAVIHYNGRFVKGADEYLVKVMEAERRYERLFNENMAIDLKEKVTVKERSIPENETQKRLVYHKVESGDTLWKIAKIYNVELVDLVKCNNIENPDLIIRGSTLKIVYES